MRIAMLATAAMNLLGAIMFLPSAAPLRAMNGLPSGHPFYLSTLAAFVLIIGAGYLFCGVTGRADRLFIAVAATGKLAFACLVFGFAATGLLAAKAATAGIGDLFFGTLFLAWLLRAPRAPRLAAASE
jgi:hypothetical protein